jgi:hypothetical protein
VSKISSIAEPESFDGTVHLNTALKQCCGLLSGFDGIWILGDLWIRIWIRTCNRIWIQEGKNGPEKKKIVDKFHLFKCWVLYFEDILYGSLVAIYGTGSIFASGFT